ncbi:MAG TPA: 7-cyano-7-deazaguanine synthase, partial [Usitatibacter sp.]|nr:7-cyano-7-deazaguanine synthase [Usitatibacter sp.]
RPEFLAAFERVANLATRRAVEGAPIRIEAPIVRLSKAEIVQRGDALGVDYSMTVSCYDADREGRACGTCDACRLRREGFRAATLADPTRYRDGATFA